MVYWETQKRGGLNRALKNAEGVVCAFAINKDILYEHYEHLHFLFRFLIRLFWSLIFFWRSVSITDNLVSERREIIAQYTCICAVHFWNVGQVNIDGS